MRINTNMNAMTALNQSSKNTALAGTSMGKISSGERINKAGDDAAGMAISEKMRSQIRGLDQAGKNTQDGISVVQTAEGAMEEVGNIAQRMRELSVQSANETNSAEDRTKIAEELTQLHSEIDRIASSTQFNGKDLLNGTEKIGEYVELTTTNVDKFEISGVDLKGLADGEKVTVKTEVGGATTDTKVTVTVGTKEYTLDGVVADTTAGSIKNTGELTLKAVDGSELKLNVKEATTVITASTDLVTAADADIKGQNINLQVGANTSDSQQLNVKIQNVDTASLGLTTNQIDDMKAGGTAGTTAATKMIDALDTALEKVNTSRANLGATQNRLETAQSNLTTSSENLTAAESRIRDVDVAKEMMNLSKLNLLAQASQAMMGQAKQQPEGVMQILR